MMLLVPTVGVTTSEPDTPGAAATSDDETAFVDARNEVHVESDSLCSCSNCWGRSVPEPGDAQPASRTN